MGDGAETNSWRINEEERVGGGWIWFSHCHHFSLGLFSVL